MQAGRRFVEDEERRGADTLVRRGVCADRSVRITPAREALDELEPLALAAAEGNRAGAESLAKRLGRHRKHLANVVKDAEVERRGGFRRTGKLRLIHEDDLGDLPRADELFQSAGLILTRDALCVKEVFVE